MGTCEWLRGEVQWQGQRDTCREWAGIISHFEDKKWSLRTSLVVQWLSICSPNAGGPGFNPWSGNRIPHATAKPKHCNCGAYILSSPCSATKSQRSQNQQLFKKRKEKRSLEGNSLVVQWLGLWAFTARAQVQSLVRELRSCKPLWRLQPATTTTKIRPKISAQDLKAINYQAVTEHQICLALKLVLFSLYYDTILLPY